MRCFAIIAACVLALAGCKKKPKPAEPDPAPAQKGDGLPPEKAAPSGGGGNGGIIAAGGGIGVVNPQAALGGGGGGGAAMAVRKAAVRTTDLNEMKSLGEFIELMRDDVGRMPTRERILTDLRQGSPKLFSMISEGSIILTGTTEGGGLWAFSADADKTPGFAVIGGRATRISPDDLRPYLQALPPSVLQPQQPPQPAPMGKIDNRPAPQPAPPAGATLPVGQKDMEDVRLLIDTASGASGRMPTPQQVAAFLQQGGSPAFELVQKKAITLTGATTREGVWAYETAAVQRGGLAASANGTETLTAAELRRRLGR